MVNVRFTNIFRNVVIPMTEERVEALRPAADLKTVLTPEEYDKLVKGFTYADGRKQIPFDEIWAKDDNQKIVWISKDPEPLPRIVLS